MQKQTDADAETREQDERLRDFLRDIHSIQCEWDGSSGTRQTRFHLAFTFLGKAPSPISLETFRRMWIQIVLEPHIAFLAIPVSWHPRENILIIAPRRDRDDLDVYANIAIGRGGDPRTVKLGVGKTFFRTFPVATIC